MPTTKNGKGRVPGDPEADEAFVISVFNGMEREGQAMSRDFSLCSRDHTTDRKSSWMRMTTFGYNGNLEVADG